MIEPIYFVRGKQRFEVRYDPKRTDLAYAGYVDGVLSVTASRADIAVRALIKKHITRDIPGVVIDLAAHRSVRRAT